MFLWGQKQERTPTWYSMFIENLPGMDVPGAACPSVDAMQFNWSGNWPANLAPKVERMTINDQPAAGDVRLNPGDPILARVAATDPDDEDLRYVWELMEEPAVLGVGGSQEPRPEALGDAVKGTLPQLNLLAPLKSGEYRLFVYVLDNNGHVGTANIPFQVGPVPTPRRQRRAAPFLGRRKRSGRQSGLTDSQRRRYLRQASTRVNTSCHQS